MSTMRLGQAALALSSDGRWRSHRRVVCNVSTGPVALMLLVLMIVKALHGPDPAFDFRFAYWPAGGRVLSGRSPYVWTATQFQYGLTFVYPALSAVVFAPLSLLPLGFSSVLFTFVCIALVPLALWTLGVRDWRIYGVALIWEPVYAGWQTANESLFLMLGLACLWRWRDRPMVAGLLTAALISLKTVMWPLALWLLVTRRWRASVYALIAGLLLNLAAWSVIGFGQIGAFLHASRISTDLQWHRGFAIPALLWHLGADRALGLTVMLVAAVALVVAVAYSALARRDEILALTLAVALALVSSPLVWSHYFVLMIVPLALLRPRLDWLWACPLLLWITAKPSDAVHTWAEIAAWVIWTVMFVTLVRQTTPTVVGVRR